MAISASPQRPGESDDAYAKRLRHNQRARESYRRRKMGESVEHTEARLVAQEIGIDRPSVRLYAQRVLAEAIHMLDAGGLDDIGDVLIASQAARHLHVILPDDDDGTTPEQSGLRKARAMAYAMLKHDDAQPYLDVLTQILEPSPTADTMVADEQEI
ncbi:MAG: hypothetical protein OXN95_05935 [bacterium]|nr:hypothetical protein [bacterium]